MGFYHYSDGNIHVPGICFADLWPWFQDRVLVDVLRHEYGHALEDKYPKYFHGREFKRAFGAEYGDAVVFKEGDEENYVSQYAQQMTQEDFAETFMYYMKYNGALPRQFSRSKAIRLKWETVAAICQDIAKCKK